MKRHRFDSILFDFINFADIYNSSIQFSSKRCSTLSFGDMEDECKVFRKTVPDDRSGAERR